MDDFEIGQLAAELRYRLQTPARDGVFDSSDVIWYPSSTQSATDSAQTETVILFDRVDDFIEGESAKHSSIFTIAKQKRTELGALKRPRTTSALLETSYQCEYGPQDYSNPALLPDRVKAAGKKIAKGESKKRGCQAHFKVQQCYADSTLARITCPAAGIQHSGHGRHAPGTKFAYQGRLSDAMLSWIESRLMLGMRPADIFSEHVATQSRLANTLEDTQHCRDDFLQMQDIRNLQSRLADSTWRLSKNPGQGVYLWCEKNSASVFLYQEQRLEEGHEVGTTFSEDAFILGIMFEFQRRKLLELGSNGLLALDATFGTNSFGFSLYTIMVFDKFRNGIPVAWVITSSGTEKDTTLWLSKLKEKLLTCCPVWAPSGFLVDDDKAEINALRQVASNLKFQEPTGAIHRVKMLSHLASCLAQSFQEPLPVVQIRDVPLRQEVFNALTGVMYLQVQPLETQPEFLKRATEQLDGVYKSFEKSAAVQSFLNYHRSHYSRRLGMWCVGARAFSRSGQNTNSALEAYHGVMKSKLKTSRKTSLNRDPQWLLKELETTILGHYVYQDRCKTHDFVINTKAESMVKEALAGAHAIADEAVRLLDNGEATVESSVHQNARYNVYGACPGSDTITCTCPEAVQGETCKHQLRVLKMACPELSDNCIIHFLGRHFGSSAGGLLKLWSNGCEQLQANQSPHALTVLREGSRQDAETVHPDEDAANEDGDCSSIQIIQASPAAKARTRLRSGLSNACERLYQLAEEDFSMVEQILPAVQQLVAGQERIAASRGPVQDHPQAARKGSNLIPARNGWGKSLKRQKPFVERATKKRGRKQPKENVQQSQTQSSQPVEPKRLQPLKDNHKKPAKRQPFKQQLLRP